MSADIIQHPTFDMAIAAPHQRGSSRSRRARHLKVERLPSDRVRLALEASWELDAIGAALLAGFGLRCSVQQGKLERTLHARIVELVSVVMSITGGDDGRDTAEMREVVHGVKLPERRS